MRRGQSEMRAAMLAGLLAAGLGLSGCGGGGGNTASNTAPPRVSAPADIPERASTIEVPISAELDDLTKLINKEVPTTLLTIDKKEKACFTGKIIGKVACHIVGKVTRGPITLSGKGDTLKLVMPVSATVSAKDVGGIIKSETATAAAQVRADVKLGIKGDWEPTAKVDVDYSWTTKPGIEMLGRRFTFAGKADPELAKLIKKLEGDIPKHLAKLNGRDKLESAWSKGFTSVMLNRENPEAWLRFTPQKLRYDGYFVEGNQLVLKLAAQAVTETFLGARPPNNPVTPLPPPSAIDSTDGFKFHLPVIADYGQIEPVLEKALGKLSKKPITVPVAGEVTPQFGKVEMYTTTGNRLALGLELQVRTSRELIAPRGRVWLTGVPYNEPGSQKIFVRDLQIAGNADTPSFRVLLAVVQSDAVMGELNGSLSQDFARDYAKLMASVDRALSELRTGDFVISATIKDVVNGVVMPVGQGLYLPVDAKGIASIRYDPLTPAQKAARDAERAKKAEVRLMQDAIKAGG
jgi:hypothetical protein